MPADGYYHVAPLGTFDHPTGVKQVIDKKACEAMVNAFQKDKAADTNFPGLLVDFDHFSHDSDQPSSAAGWIEDLQNREDGLYAKVKWSTPGETAVKNGSYRLVSPVWRHADCEDLGGDRIRPLRLDGVGVTNTPVIKGMKPLSNSEKVAVEAMLNRARQVVDEPVNVINIPRAADRRRWDGLLENAGTSAGAKKGWQTRHGAMANYHANEAGNAYAKGDIEKGDMHSAKAAEHLAAAKAAGKGMQEAKLRDASLKASVAPANVRPPPLPKSGAAPATPRAPFAHTSGSGIPRAAGSPPPLPRAAENQPPPLPIRSARANPFMHGFHNSNTKRKTNLHAIHR